MKFVMELFEMAALKDATCSYKNGTQGEFVLVIGPESDHWQCLSLKLTYWLQLLLSKLDWFDPGVWRYAYSKLVKVVTLADASDEDRVGNSLLQDRFGHNPQLLFRLWTLLSRFWSWSSAEILKLKFGQYFAADVWLRLRSWILVNILKLGLLKIFTLDLVAMLMFCWDFEVNA